MDIGIKGFDNEYGKIFKLKVSKMAQVGMLLRWIKIHVFIHGGTM